MAGDKRPRAGACTTCRVRKRRCVPAGDKYNSCELCLSLSIPCSLSTLNQDSGPFTPTNGSSAGYSAAYSHHQVAEKPPAPEPPRKEINLSISQALPPEEPTVDFYLLATPALFLELVPLYFRFIHNVAHTLFHEASFLRLLNEGRASVIHVHAMCALAARFSKNPIFDGISPRSRGKAYASEAMRLLQERMAFPSLETIQAAILLGYYFGGEVDIQTKHVYVGIARMHADALSLWDVPMNSTVVRREECRRTWLSVRIADPWTTADMSMAHTPVSNRLNVLPEVDDVAFHTYDPELLRETHGHSSSRCDMWVQMAGTLDIYTRINLILMRLSRGVISFDTYRKEVPLLQERLDRWAQSLPQSLAYSITNLMFFVKQRLGRTFLSMHLRYHHCRQMLFFPFLNARASQDTAPLGDGAVQCKKSANMVSEIIQQSMRTDDCQLHYFLYGHIAVVSSCVYLHALLFSEDSSELRTVRQRLVSNFEYLMGLKAHWPVVEQMVTRLRTFQDACQDSISSPFVLDNWMTRFIVEHTSILSERQIPGPQPLDSNVQRLSQYNTGDESGIFGLTDSLKTSELSRAPLNVPTHAKGLDTECRTLSSLLNDHSLTSEALVNNALNWLLE